LYIHVLYGKDMAQHDATETVKHLEAFLPLADMQIPIEDFLEHLRVGHGLKFSSGYGTDQDRERTEVLFVKANLRKVVYEKFTIRPKAAR